MAIRKSKCSQTGDLNVLQGAIFSQNVCFNNVHMQLKKNTNLN